MVSVNTGLMHSYHNVAKLRQIHGTPGPSESARYTVISARRKAMEALRPPKSSIATPVDLNVQIANLLPQRVAVEAQQIGRPDLIAPGRR
jgi:hypothetical protein